MGSFTHNKPRARIVGGQNPVIIPYKVIYRLCTDRQVLASEVYYYMSNLPGRGRGFLKLTPIKFQYFTINRTNVYCLT